MKNRLFITLSITGLIIALSNCTSDTQSSAEINIKFTGFVSSENALEFFERQSPIAIETSGDTLMIPSFVRIIENEGIFYALDRDKSKIFGFDRNGKIVTYISSRGKSDLEYIGIDDITWDSSKDCLAILAQTKILYADKSGRIFESFPLPTYYNSIASCGEQTVLANSTYVNKKHSEFSLTLLGKDKQFNEILPTLPEYAPFCSVNTQSLTSVSDHVLFSRLFDSNIYSISKNVEITPKIHVDYGTSEFIPEKGKEYDCVELYKKCKDFKQFYALTDIQESDNHISYMTNLSGLMIVSKETATATFYDYLYDFERKIPLTKYIPVEGSNNLVFFYIDSSYFNIFAENSGNKELIELASKVTSESNPIFLPYRLK